MKRWLAPILASLVLIAVLAAATNLQWDRVWRTLAHLDWTLVAAGLGLYAASFAMRGVRLSILLPGSRDIVQMASIGARHILLAVVLPFRSGEATLPILLGREAGRPLHESLSVLGLMRILDLLAVAAFFLAGLTLTGTSAPEEVSGRALAVGGLLLAGLVVMRPVARLCAPLAHSTRKPVAFLGQAAANVGAIGTGRLAAAVATSFVTWFFTYATCWVLLLSMAGPEALGASARIDFPTSLVGTTGLHLSSVIPLSPIAGVGTWEAGWATFYSQLVGMDPATAAESAIVNHVLIFAFLVLLGGLAFLVRGGRAAAAADGGAPEGARWSG